MCLPCVLANRLQLFEHLVAPDVCKQCLGRLQHQTKIGATLSCGNDDNNPEFFKFRYHVIMVNGVATNQIVLISLSAGDS